MSAAEEKRMDDDWMPHTHEENIAWAKGEARRLRSLIQAGKVKPSDPLSALAAKEPTNAT